MKLFRFLIGLSVDDHVAARSPNGSDENVRTISGSHQDRRRRWRMMTWRDRRVAPDESEGVVTSVEVTELRQPVTRVVRWRQVWMFLSGFESDDSWPQEVHFLHLLETDPGLATVRLEPGEYALRGTRDGAFGAWRVYGPFPDRHIQWLLDSGTIVSQQEGLSRDIP